MSCSITRSRRRLWLARPSEAPRRVGEGGEQDSADFGDFPHIAAVLQGAGLLGVAETSTRMEDVREFLTALAGVERLEASRIRAVVVSTERLLESRGIGKKDVERALRFGGGGHASQVDKGLVVRELLSVSEQEGVSTGQLRPQDKTDSESQDGESEAIRAFFKSGKVREAAFFELPEDLDDEEEAEAHELAASLAVKRLKARVGASWVPKERLQSLAELRLLRVEEAVRLDAEREGERSGGKGGAKPLAKEFVFGAVASDVVARLHEAEMRVPPQVEFRQGDDVGAGVRMVPDQIRADLARAIGSNGRVDAAGEQCYTRTSIPRSTSQRTAAALAESVQIALRAVTAGDESGLQYLSPAAAFSFRLAQSALAGEFKVTEFAREMKLALNVASKGMCALDELRETWRLIKSALLAMGMVLYGMSHCDEGIMQVDARINATAASLRLEAGDLRTWLCRVLDLWGLRVRQFRQVDGAWPVFAECTSECGKFYSLHARRRQHYN
ncbi:MAG: hypothetical protein SGPRY_011294 [Prymnesium sp.]